MSILVVQVIVTLYVPLVLHMTGKAQSYPALSNKTFLAHHRSYAIYLASWGYAVLQYDTPVFSLIQDIVEVKSLPIAC